MKTETFTAYEIYVPMFSNDGAKFHVEYHKEWDEKVKAVTGGMTIFRAGRGKWVDPKDGITYEDRVIPVRIFCSKEQIETIAAFTIEHYNQVAIAALKISSEALIFTKEEEIERYRQEYASERHSIEDTTSLRSSFIGD